jgi:hypothetical protein
VRTELFKTLARVNGARKAKRLIAGLAFSAPEFSEVDESWFDIECAFNIDEEVKGRNFWLDMDMKYWRLTTAPCGECGKHYSPECPVCESKIPF